MKCTKIQKMFHLILLSIVVFLFLCLPSSFQIVAAAQNDLLTHKDITNDFSVSYPGNWIKQDNVYGTHGVRFSPNPTTRDNVLIDVIQQPGADLDSLIQEKIDSISSRPGASISLVNPTTLGGNPAYKVEYMWEGDKILETWTLIGDKLYAISYIGEGEEGYQQNLPVAQNIIDSFQFTDGISPPATISQPETTTTGDSFLTYEDAARGFKMQYPSDWNKTDYPLTIPFVSFISPAQNATDNLFENLGVVIELLPMQNITLDQYSHGVIEQLGLESPDFNVTSPPKETMLGGVPAYNMTYTDIRTDENDPSVVHEIRAIVTWAVKDGKAYTILYAGTESQFNYSLHKAQKMIDSFSFVPPQQISISKSPQTELDNATKSHQSGNNFLTYFNSTYGVQIGYPQNWNVSTSTYSSDPKYDIAYIFPENETSLDLSTERLPYQEITLDDYLGSKLEFPYLNLSEANTNTTTLAGRPAYKLVHYDLIPESLGYTSESGLRKVMEIGTIINGSVYQATYSTSPDRFSQNLPTIQKMLDTLEIIPTNQPPSSPSVNDVEFLTYENSTFGIRMQYPSKWLPTDEISSGNISFVLPDEESNQPGLFDFMRPQDELPEVLDAVLFVEAIPLPYSYNVSESAYIDEYVSIWVSGAKENLTNFNLTKSKASTLDDSPAQILEFTYSDEVSPSLEHKALSIFAVENNILYHIRYQPLGTTSYYDNIPIIRKMIESFEILDKKGILHTETF